MIVNAVEAQYARLPILPEDWRRIAPELCRGVDPDYLLLDLGPVVGRPRYVVMELRSDSPQFHLFDGLADVHAPLAGGGLGIAASLFVPLARAHDHHQGHVAALYREERRFDDADVERLQQVAQRLLSLLSAG